MLSPSSHETKHAATKRAIYGYPAAFGARLNETASESYRIHVLPSSHDDACTAIPDTSAVPNPFDSSGHLSPGAVLVRRGNCSFLQKARNLQSAGYNAMILFDDQHVDSCAEMGVAANDSASDVTILSVSVTATGALVL